MSKLTFFLQRCSTPCILKLNLICAVLCEMAAETSAIQASVPMEGAVEVGVWDRCQKVTQKGVCWPERSLPGVLENHNPHQTTASARPKPDQKVIPSEALPPNVMLAQWKEGCQRLLWLEKSYPAWAPSSTTLWQTWGLSRAEESDLYLECCRYAGCSVAWWTLVRQGRGIPCKKQWVTRCWRKPLPVLKVDLPEETIDCCQCL